MSAVPKTELSERLLPPALTQASTLGSLKKSADVSRACRVSILSLCGITFLVLGIIALSGGAGIHTATLGNCITGLAVGICVIAIIDHVVNFLTSKDKSVGRLLINIISTVALGIILSVAGVLLVDGTIALATAGWMVVVPTVVTVGILALLLALVDNTHKAHL